eukprot:scaffold6038_cov98-Skeletonema_menzelii.AAC.3
MAMARIAILLFPLLKIFQLDPALFLHRAKLAIARITIHLPLLLACFASSEQSGNQEQQNKRGPRREKEI